MIYNIDYLNQHQFEDDKQFFAISLPVEGIVNFLIPDTINGANSIDFRFELG